MSCSSTKTAEDGQLGGVHHLRKTYNDFDVLTWLDADGNVVSQSQKRILNALACDADTPALHRTPTIMNWWQRR